VIEDDADAGDTLAEVLTLIGHHVRVARDATSGLAAAREMRPDVIVCDIGLPDMTGYDLARAVRRDESLRNTRLVALSGYALPEDELRAENAGFDAHLPKPPPLERLDRFLREGRDELSG
jgi:two-component system CheB/CheR fusion protein